MATLVSIDKYDHATGEPVTSESNFNSLDEAMAQAKVDLETGQRDVYEVVEGDNHYSVDEVRRY